MLKIPRRAVFSGTEKHIFSIWMERSSRTLHPKCNPIIPPLLLLLPVVVVTWYTMCYYTHTCTIGSVCVSTTQLGQCSERSCTEMERASIEGLAAPLQYLESLKNCFCKREANPPASESERGGPASYWRIFSTTTFNVHVHTHEGHFIIDLIFERGAPPRGEHLALWGDLGGRRVICISQLIFQAVCVSGSVCRESAARP